MGVIKVCPECGKEFEAARAYQVYCKGPHTTKCVVCGKEITYTCRPTDKPKTCSIECREILKKQSVAERYGVDNVAKLPNVRDMISKAHKLGSQYQKTPKTKGVQLTERICAFCGKPFIAKGTAKYCEGPHYTNCVVCGKPFEWDKKFPSHPKKSLLQNQAPL